MTPPPLPAPPARGARLFWLKQSRGGYGFISWVPVVVLGQTPKRVRVFVPTRGGGAVERTVTLTQLRERNELDEIDVTFDRMRLADV